MATIAQVFDISEAADMTRRPPANSEGTPAVLSPTVIESDLAAKTVFLKVRFGNLGNSKRVQGSDVLSTDADKDRLNVSKTLLDSAELDAIRKADGQMRTYLYNLCLPFELGIALLPIGLIETAEAKLQAYKTERATLVETFITAYPTLCASAAVHLKGLYNQADYLGVDELRQKFAFEWQYVSFGVPTQLQVISPELFAQEQEKARQQIQTATDEITGLMREHLYEMVAHLQDKLTPTADGKQRILRVTAIKNVQDFLDTFDIRNVTGDSALAEQVARLRSLLDGKSAATLRTSDRFREDLRSGMESITASLSTMVEEKAARKFRMDD